MIVIASVGMAGAGAVLILKKFGHKASAAVQTEETSEDPIQEEDQQEEVTVEETAEDAVPQDEETSEE